MEFGKGWRRKHKLPKKGDIILLDGDNEPCKVIKIAFGKVLYAQYFMGRSYDFLTDCEPEFIKYPPKKELDYYRMCE